MERKIFKKYGKIVEKMEKLCVFLYNLTNPIFAFIITLIIIKSKMKIFDILKLFLYTAILWFISEKTKMVFKRERPYKKMNINFGFKTDPFHSFPSTHSAAAIFLFLALKTNKISYLLLIIPVLRVLTLQHWITDILGSFLISYMYYILLNLLQLL